MSDQEPFSWLIFCWISTLTVSIFTPSSNSSTTMDTLSMELEVTFLMRSRVAMDCSRGLVMSASTVSGLAPGSVVTRIT